MIVVNNSKYWLISLAVSVIIFLIVYFTVIKSSTDTANNILKSTNQQVQQALKNANKETNGAASQAAKLQACIAAAGTDASKAAACAQKFTP
jgi:F0F1-type ATP synthase membrane subunit b/b'